MHIVFNENTGLLMPGEYKMSFEEFEKTFVYNYKRRSIFIGFKKLLVILKEIDCDFIYVDGSFVTLKTLPGDIDVCWNMNNKKEMREIQIYKLFEICPQLFNINDQKNREFVETEFCADVFPANSIESECGLMFKDFFQIDKETELPKGIIIISLL